MSIFNLPCSFLHRNHFGKKAANYITDHRAPFSPVSAARAQLIRSPETELAASPATKPLSPLLLPPLSLLISPTAQIALSAAAAPPRAASGESHHLSCSCSLVCGQSLSFDPPDSCPAQHRSPTQPNLAIHPLPRAIITVLTNVEQISIQLTTHCNTYRQIQIGRTPSGKSRGNGNAGEIACQTNGS